MLHLDFDFMKQSFNLIIFKTFLYNFFNCPVYELSDPLDIFLCNPLEPDAEVSLPCVAVISNVGREVCAKPRLNQSFVERGVRAGNQEGRQKVQGEGFKGVGDIWQEEANADSRLLGSIRS